MTAPAAPATDDRPGGLLAWQWSKYPPAHRNRINLLTHALTAPVYILGTLALVNSPFVPSLWLGLGGLAAMGGVMVLQGRGHKREGLRPSPFRSRWDLVQRLFVEQWVTFPRYVLSGEFARAWRGEPVGSPPPG